MTQPVADQRSRRRVTTIVGVGLLNAASTTSKGNVDITFCNRHYVTIIPSATLSAGTVSVRARPMSQGSTVTGFAPVGIEAIALSGATNLQFTVAGFFDQFAAVIGTAVTGGTIAVIVNSTIEN